jgi:CubicO group peptidase (beta-lactamase class C family)
MKQIIVLLAIIFLLPGHTHAQKKSLENQIKTVENNLIPYVPVKGFKGWNLIDRMKYYKVPGVSIAVIKDFKIAWAKGYGLADTLKKTQVTTSTLFSAGSISKFISAVTALKMVESKQMELNAPINNYLSSWKIKENEFTQKTPITLRMLLSHTAGTSQSSYFGFTPNKLPLPSIVEILNGAPVAESRPVVVNSEPNKTFRYSGGGSMIVQMAMMDVAKKPFENLVQDLIFEPLKMKNSTFAQPLPPQYQSQAAWAYSSASWFKGMPYVYPQQAAAGLYTTPTDLAKFFIAVQRSYQGKGKLLSQAYAKKMLTPQAAVSDGGYREEIGIGPFLIQRTDNQSPKGTYFEFTGVNAGFLAYGIANLTEGYGVVIMLNSGDDVNGLGKEIRRAVAKTYNWYQFLPVEIEPIQLKDQELDEYVGRYRKSVDEVLYLKKENNYLVENINDGADIYCFPIKKDTIVFTDYNVNGFFGRNDAGEIASLRSQWQDTPMRKMSADEFSPGEYLKAKQYAKAQEGYRQMQMNEYQISYLVYELLHRPNADMNAIKALLDLALDQHPKSAIVYSRWGDYHLLRNDKTSAITSFKKALELDPSDQQALEMLNDLTK